MEPETAIAPVSASATNLASVLWASRLVPLTVLLRCMGLPSAVYPASTRNRHTPAPRSVIVYFMTEPRRRLLDHF